MPASDANSIASLASPDRRLEHRAVRAWQRVAREPFVPAHVETLKSKCKSAVYRLNHPRANRPAIIAKRCRAETAVVERLVYEECLPRSAVPALQWHGFLAEPGGRFCWCFLEDGGGEVYSPRRTEHRLLSGRWLAELHRAPLPASLQARLPDRGPGHYLHQLRTARRTLRRLAGHPAFSRAESGLVGCYLSLCDVAEAHWSELEGYLADWPRSLVHGDFAAKNLRIHRPPPGPHLQVFDWEMAGWGVAAGDLAQGVGRCASPDLATYRRHLGRGTRRPGLHEVRRLADYGRVLRLIDKLWWSTVSMEGDAYECLVNPISHLNSYTPQWDAALRILGWRRRD